MVPPLASAIHQTYSAIAKPQATGMSMPQTPMPLTNSQVTAMTRTSSMPNEMPKPIHHHSGALGHSTRSLTSSLNDRNVTPGRMIGAGSWRSAAMVTRCRP